MGRTIDHADILSRREAGETLKEIGARYGVSQERMRQIIYKLHWERDNPPNPNAENLEDVGFSTRTINGLLGHGVRTRAQLQCYSARDLARIPNLGKVSIAEIAKVVSLSESSIDRLSRERHTTAWLRGLLARAYKHIPDEDNTLREEIRAALLRTDPRNVGP